MGQASVHKTGVYGSLLHACGGQQAGVTTVQFVVLSLASACQIVATHGSTGRL